MLPSEMGTRQVPGDERWMVADQGVGAIPRFFDAHRVDQHADMGILDFGAIHALEAQGPDALDRCFRPSLEALDVGQGELDLEGAPCLIGSSTQHRLGGVEVAKPLEDRKSVV